MQTENYVSTTRIIAVTLWVTVAATLLAAWAVAFTGYPGMGYMLALTAGVLAPAAGVAHIKVYSMKVTNVIRITSGLSGPSENTAALHRVH
jgi:hypothetical protein